jgi:rhodanese-related sulfurtransferase
VALQLRKRGIQQVRPLAGGFYGWRDKGYPLIPFYPELSEALPVAAS